MPLDKINKTKKAIRRDFPVVQWLQIHLAVWGNVGSIPVQGIRIPHVVEQLGLSHDH